MQGDIASIKQRRMKVAAVKPSSERVEQTRGLLAQIFEHGPATWGRPGQGPDAVEEESPCAS